MTNNVIAIVPLRDMSLIVWFEGGTSRSYSVESFGITDPAVHESAHVINDGLGIAWSDGTEATTDQLLTYGQEVDFVGDEKKRLLRDLGDIRRAASFSQTKLGDAAGIRQSVISRIEGCEISPQINTLLRLLAPLGKTLKIVDINDR